MSWLRVIGNRLMIAIPTLFIASVVVFALVQLTPGDPAAAYAGEHATAERLAQIREQLGLDRPTIEQFTGWLGDAVTGDLGKSLLSGERVTTLITSSLPATLHLVVGALIIAIVFGVAAGVAAAVWSGTRDGVLSSIATLGISMPNFWLGMLLVTFFSLRLGWFPAIGYVSFFDAPLDSVRSLLLPCIALGSGPAAEIMRQVRSAMLESLKSDSARTLVAKGLTRRRIIWQHGLKNAAVPIVTVIGLMINRLLGATVVVETVFGISGIGNLIVGAVSERDYPIIQGVVLVMATVVVVTNMCVDVAYRKLDPRISA